MYAFVAEVLNESAAPAALLQHRLNLEPVVASVPPIARTLSSGYSESHWCY
jgi:hypothetical protein